MSKNSYWKDTYQVRGYQIDIKGNLSVQNICNFLLEGAANHARILDVSVSKLLENDLTWMLSRFHFRIERYPEPDEILHLSTWPSGVKKLFSCRDFIIYDDEKIPIINATSGWLVVDINRRRPTRLPQFILDVQQKDAERAMDEDFGKLEGREEYEREKEFDIRISDIDFNRHVTSTSYIDWILETVDMEFQESHDLREMAIEYRAEAFYGESIISQTSIFREDELVIGEHKISDQTKTKEHCVANTFWEMKK
jgi:acyl-ACP thioesterase